MTPQTPPIAPKRRLPRWVDVQPHGRLVQVQRRVEHKVQVDVRVFHVRAGDGRPGRRAARDLGRGARVGLRGLGGGVAAGGHGDAFDGGGGDVLWALADNRKDVILLLHLYKVLTAHLASSQRPTASMAGCTGSSVRTISMPANSSSTRGSSAGISGARTISMPS